MSVVRRGSAVVVVAGALLLGGPAWAQEDPCAPGPDGAVPEMCQSGPAAPDSDTGTVGVEPDAPVDDGGAGPCTSVSPDGGFPVDEGVAGEPAPGGATEPGSAPDEPVSSEPVGSEPVALADDTVICTTGVPVGAPEVTGGGGGTQVDAAAAELPRTGSTERLLALTAVGAGLVVLGAGATAAGRRRRT